MAALAERQANTLPEHLFDFDAAEAQFEHSFDFDIAEVQFEEPVVYVVPDMAEDVRSREQADCLIKLGEMALSKTVEAPKTVPILSLQQAIHEAADGNSEARKMVETNVRTDVIERTIKSGHVMSVDLMVDEAGRIQQHGQSLESVQANSLKFAADSWQMRERTEAEVRNAYRMQNLYEQGLLHEYSFVVLSMAADNMSHAEMNSVGFFTQTMSCAIQVTTAKHGRLITESAFVAGVSAPCADRHDKQAIIGLGREFGVDYEGLSAAQIIDKPMLIHNSLLENGAVDVVKLYDEQRGDNSFFGEDKQPDDYVIYRDACLRREQSFAPKVQKITNELISEAVLITSPLKATRRLHEISEKHMVEQAIYDKSIDVQVFGSVSAHHIEMARMHYEQGNIEAVQQEQKQAEKFADSSSCPGGGLEALFRMSGSSKSESASSEEDKYGSLNFTCQKGHRNTRPRGRLIPKCTTCGISVRC